MFQKIRILDSKLSKPSLTDTVFRDRLQPVLEELKNKKLTTVIAGAGYGKTTLVSQACADQGSKTIWYRLDSMDKDFITFLHYLVAGFPYQVHTIPP